MVGQYIIQVGGKIKTQNMIKSKKETGIEIDLTGPDGNAFVLIGYANRLAKQLGLDGRAIQKEMIDGNYEHLVKTFDKHFGEFVTLYR
jgi:hypothetical protein